MTLESGGIMEYALTVPVMGTRRENRQLRRAAPDGRFFCGPSFFNGGLRRAAFGLAGILLGRFLTPTLVRHSRCEKRSGGFHIKRNLS